MIDKAEFAAGMGLLAGTFNRTLDGAISRAYYAVLGQRLTTEEFQRAVTKTLETETFWPSPALLLSKVKADDLSAALLALEHVRRTVFQAGGVRFLPYSAYEAFDDATKAAIKEAGGLALLCDSDSKAVAKRFTDAFTGRRALPSPDAPRVLSLVSGRDRAAGADRD